jgi:tape measure domain-containing protein
VALANLILKIRAEGAEAAKRGVDQLSESVTNLSRSAAIGAGAFAALSAVALGGLMNSAFQSAVELDSLTRGLATVSKNAEDLTGQMSRLKEVAKLPGLGFAEAIQGSIRLQAAGLSASLAERSLSAFGNALASVGGGKDQLDGVIVALSQISSKGVISAEEINQIAERVPQVRRLLAGAFGTSDTEQIQKMGLTAQDAIARIVAEAEKLPRASGGIKNFIENLSDAFQDALRPLGQGIVEMIEGSGGGVENLLSGLKDIGRQVGEVFASIGKSGALSEVLNTIAGAFQGLSGGMDISPLESIAGVLLSIVNNIPDAFKAGSEAISVIAYNLEVAGKKFYTNIVAAMGVFGAGVQSALEEMGKAFRNPVEFFAGGHFQNAFQAISPEVLSSQYNAIQMMSGVDNLKYKELPDLNRFNLTEDSARFAEMIRANRGALKSLPDGLIFGGDQGDGAQKPATIQDKVDALLQRIEANTRKTAEAVTLKELSTGGSDLSAPTALELRRAGGVGRASGDYKAAAGYVANDLERALVARVLDNLRQGGAGLSPARQQ